MLKYIFGTITCLTFMGWGAASLQAQVFPVQASLMLNPPASPILGSYVALGGNKLNCIIAMNDASELSYQSRLVLTIEGAGVSIRTKPEFITSPLILTYGTPQLLTGVDLAAYFNPDNLNFQGISKQDFLSNGGRLPEGFYSICIQAFDYQRDNLEPISNKACSNLFLQEHDTPIVTTPSGTATPITPQNLLFRWEQLHYGFAAQYEFELFEINDNNAYIPIQNIVNSYAPLLRVNTGSSKTLLYDVSQPALTPGRDYIIRIRATDPMGQQYFKNNGYSELVTFQYGQACDLPLGATAIPNGPDAVEVSWNVSPDAPAGTKYIVRYKEKDNPDANWYEDEAYTSPHDLENLAAGTTYLVEIQKDCGGGVESGYAPVGEITTETTPFIPEFNCNPSNANLSVPSNQTPLTGLQTGQTFSVSGFDVTVKQLNNAGGDSYTGVGTITIPYLEHGLVKVNFNNVKINTDREVYEGTVNAATNGMASRPDVRTVSFSISEDSQCSAYTPPPRTDAHGFLDDGTHHITGTEYDPNGFNQGGIHQDTGTNLDPKGFDQNGVHHITGTQYDGNGCSQNGFTEDGTPCVNDDGGTPGGGNTDNALGDNTGPSSTVGQQLSNSIDDATLESIVKTQLAVHESNNSNTINTNRPQLPVLETEILEKIQALGVPKDLITGANNEYIREGMSQYFEKAQFDGDLSPYDPIRDPNAVALDAKIKRVFELDTALRQALRENDTILDLRTSLLAPTVSYVRSQLDSYIREHPEVDTLFANGNLTGIEAIPSSSEFQNWVNQQLDNLLNLMTRPVELLDVGDDSGFVPYRSPFPGRTTEFEQYIHSIKFRAGGNRQAFGGGGPQYDLTYGYTLPIELKKEIGGEVYTIILDRMVFASTGAILDAYLNLPVPGKPNENIAFTGTGIGFTPGGVANDAKLLLSSNARFDLGSAGVIEILGTNNETYATWDCQGLDMISLNAKMTFCRNHLLPVDNQDKVIAAPRQVEAAFTTTLRDWKEFTLQVDNMPRFQVTEVPDVIWDPGSVVLDLSETTTPSGVNFPPAYLAQNPGAKEDGANAPSWKGLYIQSLNMEFPEAFDRKDGGELGITAQHLIIDATGLTVEADAKNILTIEEGNMDGWAFSMDTMGLRVVSTALEEFSFGGQLIVPLDEKTRMGYGAFVSTDGNYAFAVDLKDSIDMDIWKAKGRLLPGSGLDVNYFEDEFKAVASLNGEMDIDGAINDSGDRVTLPKITFQKLELRNKQPYIGLGVGGHFGFNNGTAKVAGFEFTLSELRLTQGQDADADPELKVKGAIGLMSGNGGFAVGGGVAFKGDVSFTEEIMKIGYKDFNVEDMAVDVQMPGVGIKGGVSFFDKDATYGTGFRGALDAEFTPGIGVAAVAQFGAIDGSDPYRYWMVDALAKVGPGTIPLVPGALDIRGIGGGAYYHMNRPLETTQISFDQQVADMMTIGKSLSGIVYTPDKNVGLGLKILLRMAAPKEEVFNTDCQLEVQFTPSWGLNFISFDGTANIMSDMPEGKPDKDDKDNSDKIRADLSMTYNHIDKLFTADLTAYASLYGGAISGGYDQDRVGTIALRIKDAEDWYFWLGRSEWDKRVKLEMKIPMMSKGLIFNTYMNVGTDISPFPGLKVPKVQTPNPDNANDWTDLTSLSNLQIPDRAGGTQNGFIHGSALIFPTLDFKTGFMYANLSAGLGYDMMMSHYPPSTVCGDGGQIGINGWYATGQAFAFVQGGAGINVDLWGFKKKVAIADIGAKAVLQAQLPNPLWMYANIQVDYNILDGALSGSHKFEMEYGTQCELPGEDNLLADLSIIGDISPVENEQDVSVFIVPQASFNFKLDQEFSLSNPDNGAEEIFTVSLETFELLDRNGMPVAGQIQLNADKTAAAFYPEDILPGREDFTFKAIVGFKKKVGGNWQDVAVNGVPYKEERIIHFSSDEAPDHIPHQNVKYAYPLINQFNYYKDEYQGLHFVHLSRGQDYLFQVDPAEFAQKIRVVDVQSDQVVHTGNISYSKPNNRIRFFAPTSLLNDRVYRLELVNIPVTYANAAADENLSQQTTVLDDGSGGTLVTTENVLDGSLSELKEKVIYENNFRTSIYNTFDDKVAGYNFTQPWTLPVMATNANGQYQVAYDLNVEKMGVNGTNASEIFDTYETKGDNDRPVYPSAPSDVDIYSADASAGFDFYNPPLVYMEADTTVSWITQDLKPTIYNLANSHPGIGLGRSSESVEQYGWLPYRAVHLVQMEDRLLTADDVGNYTGSSGSGTLSDNTLLLDIVTANNTAFYNDLFFSDIVYASNFTDNGGFVSLASMNSYVNDEPGPFGTSLTSFTHQMCEYSYQDFIHVRSRAAWLNLNHPILAGGAFPRLRVGNYPIKVKYRIPGALNSGAARVTSSLDNSSIRKTND